MNIFDIYLDKINFIVNKGKKSNQIIVPENISGINVDIPPDKFDADISTNVAMVLAKPNNKNPLEIAEIITKLLIQEDDQIDKAETVKPGFINIKLKKSFWNNFLKNTINEGIKYGTNKKNVKKKYLIEFVSANPTGPLHVGHSRGAILGDVLSNLLKFNNHEVVKEYYVNDYGNQIVNFTKSVYHRIREIKFNEKFPTDNEDLYPGDYLIEIAKNIIKKNKNIPFDYYEISSEILSKKSIEESLVIIK